ncbi:hypothetical protein Fmac_032733 [Flemingia macrophylla]|uniref:Large ribosomal subunit protein bL12 C-terminal domain-containing protein n=1 Tax=Flemingia macrophylla TaxID=520843 RepID=A0ABD1L5R8_9FABA
MGLHRYDTVTAPIVAMSAASTRSPAEATTMTAAEKTVFVLKLEKYNDVVKIKITKEVRAFIDLGLKEAKDLVEKVPCVLFCLLSVVFVQSQVSRFNH